MTKAAIGVAGIVAWYFGAGIIGVSVVYKAIVITTAGAYVTYRALLAQGGDRG